MKTKSEREKTTGKLSATESARLTQLLHTFRGLSFEERTHPDYKALREEKAALEAKAFDDSDEEKVT